MLSSLLCFQFILHMKHSGQQQAKLGSLHSGLASMSSATVLHLAFSQAIAQYCSRNWLVFWLAALSSQHFKNYINTSSLLCSLCSLPDCAMPSAGCRSRCWGIIADSQATQQQLNFPTSLSQPYSLASPWHRCIWLLLPLFFFNNCDGATYKHSSSLLEVKEHTSPNSTFCSQLGALCLPEHPSLTSSFCTLFHEKTVCKGKSPQQSLPLGSQEVLISYIVLTLLPKLSTRSHPYALFGIWGLPMNLNNAHHKSICCYTVPFLRARSCFNLTSLSLIPIRTHITGICGLSNWYPTADSKFTIELN